MQFPKSSLRTVGVMAAIAIAFLTITSPNREQASAVPPHDVQTADDLQSQGDLAVAVEGLRRSVDGLSDTIDDKVQSAVETRFTSLDTSIVEPDLTDVEGRLDSLESRVTELETPNTVELATTPAPDSSTAPAVVQYSQPVEVYSVPVESYPETWTTPQAASPYNAWQPPNSGQPALVTRRQTVMSVSQTSNCPGGVCTVPTISRSRTVQNRGGVLGLGVLGRRR